MIHRSVVGAVAGPHRVFHLCLVGVVAGPHRFHLSGVGVVAGPHTMIHLSVVGVVAGPHRMFHLSMVEVVAGQHRMFHLSVVGLSSLAVNTVVAELAVVIVVLAKGEVLQQLGDNQLSSFFTTGSISFSTFL